MCSRLPRALWGAWFSFLFLSFIVCCFLTLEARYILREIFAMGFNPTGIWEMFPEILPGHLVPF
jgi:hypothetical protein